MVDDNQQDEYQFPGLDVTDQQDDAVVSRRLEDETTKISKEGMSDERIKLIIRNAVIGVGGVVLLVFLVKFIGSLFSSKTTTAKTEMLPMTQPTKPIQQQSIPTEATFIETVKPAPITSAPPSITPSSPEMNQKLSNLETNQANIQSEVNSVSGQVSTINTNVNNLLTKMTDLDKVISVLTTKINEQSDEIEKLTLRVQTRTVVRQMSIPNKRVIYLRYWLQAVIPGRAWLINENGTTLTVREGSVVPGYGVVKLIDPSQGRVITSSGRIIRFSEADS